MCVGVTYSEALVAIAAVTPTVLEAGANWRQIRRAAKRLGVTFVEKTTIDLEDLEEDDSGMLAVAFPGGLQHAVYVKRGLIFDGRSGAIWDADVYVRVNKVEVLTMLVRTR